MTTTCVSLACKSSAGNGALLRQAAKRESSDNAARNADLMALGGKRKVEHLRSRFRQGKYQDALAEFKSLKYPERLSESDRKMVELENELASHEILVNADRS